MKRKRGQEKQNTSPKIENINTIFYRNCSIWHIHSHLSSHYGFIWNQHNDQLPVGLLAQLVEHCNGIAQVMGSNTVQRA